MHKNLFRKYFIFTISHLLLLCSQLSIYGAEVDSFTYRLIPLKDSLGTINAMTNSYLDKAINILNRSNSNCNEEILYRQLRRYYNNQYRGEMVKEIVKTKGIDAHWIDIETGIYQDFNWFQSPIQGLWGRLGSDPTAALIRVGDVLLGTDKFEHFMGSGFRYFEKFHLKRYPLQAALNIGNRAEAGVMGSIMTGVMSYGDLAANFNGMRFWNHLLQRDNDVLGAQYNFGPYVQCIDEKWVQVKKIDWKNYIDDSFDEGQNCSKFRTKRMLYSVERRILNLSKFYEVELECPMNRERLGPLVLKYGPVSGQILNFSGHTTVK